MRKKYIRRICQTYKPGEIIEAHVKGVAHQGEFVEFDGYYLTLIHFGVTTHYLYTQLSYVCDLPF